MCVVAGNEKMEKCGYGSGSKIENSMIKHNFPPFFLSAFQTRLVEYLLFYIYFLDLFFFLYTHTHTHTQTHNIFMLVIIFSFRKRNFRPPRRHDVFVVHELVVVHCCCCCCCCCCCSKYCRLDNSFHHSRSRDDD
jgi:hypothetical protein